jgi:hypothetical protein
MLLGDVAGLAARSIKHYTCVSHDLSSLSPAGRVFFLKVICCIASCIVVSLDAWVAHG